MFSEKEIEAYRQIKAPMELKNRIQLSVAKKKRRGKIQRIGAAAGVTAILLYSSIFSKNPAILSINGVDISFKSVEIEGTNTNIRMKNAGNEQKLQVTIPLKIEVESKAIVKVSDGTIQQEVETEALSKIGMELEIEETSIVYWKISTDSALTPSCTILTEKQTYEYVVTFDSETSVYTIKQTN